MGPLELIIKPIPPGFQSWRSQHFTEQQLSNPTISGHFADPDLGTVANVFEFFYNSDPMTAESNIRPFLGQTTLNGERYVTFTWRENPQSGITFIPQFTESLYDWNFNYDTSGQVWTVELSDSPTVEPDGTVIKAVRAAQPISSSSAAFMRLVVQW